MGSIDQVIFEQDKFSARLDSTEMKIMRGETRNPPSDAGER